MKKRKDYPVGYIRKLLSHYDELAKSPYEDAIIAKADLDKALDSLDYIEREIVTKIYIEGYPVIELERKFEELNIGSVERQAIRNMAVYMNGECILERWCRENGMESHGNFNIPDYIPGEIQQYIKDICLNYCVLKECPK